MPSKALIKDKDTYSKREIDIIIRDMGIRFSNLVRVVDNLEDEIMSLENRLSLEIAQMSDPSAHN